MRRLVRLVAMLGVVLAMTSLHAQTQRPPRGHGRLFPPQDLGLLESPDRDQWQKPQQILDALGIADASVVADVGAGAGWFTVRLARRVGPNGRVYAQDVQQEMLDAITRRVAREGLSNVVPRLGRANDPLLPPGALDAILTVDVLHEIDDRVTLLDNLRQALKPGGRLGVVDFLPGGGGPGPEVDERVPSSVIEAEAARAGLVLLRRETFLPFQYFLIFGRGAATREGAPLGGTHLTPRRSSPSPSE